MKESVNPYNNKKLYHFEELGREDILKKLERAAETFEHWKNTSFSEREGCMQKLATLLKERSPEYGRIISQEMGKPVKQARAEVEKCAWVCEYYAKNARSFLADEVIKTDAEKSFVRFEPLGVVLAIMPWNYPFWQVFRFAAPALMAGNVGVLKHASNVMKSAGNIEDLIREAGFPEGCFQNLIIGSKQVKEVIENPLVKAVTITGSTAAGSEVASSAGKAIKKTVLELGGNNALVVFADANLERAVSSCVEARFQNTGQSCIAGKRLLLQEEIAAAFTARFTAAVRELKSGDPSEEDTYIGVLAREDLAKELEEQVGKSVGMGAELLLGGRRSGAYFEPTILGGVTPEMPMFREESFGPAIGITQFKDEKEAVALVNDSVFGLGVSLFTADKARVKRLIPQLNEGAVFVNELVKSDPRLPFGGVKSSGYGRELSGDGIREFVNRKTVYIKY